MDSTEPESWKGTFALLWRPLALGRCPCEGRSRAAHSDVGRTQGNDRVHPSLMQFHRTRKTHPKPHREAEAPLSQSNLRKRTRAGGVTCPESRPHHADTVTREPGAGTRTDAQAEDRSREPRMSPGTLRSIDFGQQCQGSSVGRTVPSTNGPGRTGSPRAKEGSWPLPNTWCRNQPQWV